MACQYAFICLSHKSSAQWVLEGDIKGCFDNINHEWLLGNIPMDKAIVKQFLKAGFVYNRHLNPTKAGTPQGGIISPILANMTLDGLEKAIATKYHASKSGKIDKGNSNLEKVNFGWSNYHRSVVSKEVLNNLDYRMWNMLWRWAKRGHPDKPKKWDYQQVLA